MPKEIRPEVAAFRAYLEGRPRNPKVQERSRYLGPGRRGTPQEPGEKPRRITGGQVEQFIYDGKEIAVRSSNWKAMRYDRSANEIVVTYKGGAQWAYGNFTEADAIELVRAASKGTYGWDHIRVRGPGNAHKHRRPARRLS